MCEGMMIHALRYKVSGHVGEGSNLGLPQAR